MITYWFKYDNGLNWIKYWFEFYIVRDERATHIAAVPLLAGKCNSETDVILTSAVIKNKVFNASFCNSMVLMYIFFIYLHCKFPVLFQ